MSRPESELERRPDTVAYDLESAARTDGHPDTESGYALESGVPAPPPLRGLVDAMAHAEELVDRILADLLMHATNCVRAFGDFHLALAPSPQLESIYRRLMYDPRYRSLPWARTHLWLQFDRRVPWNDEHCGSRFIEELVATPAGMPREQYHRVDANDDGAAERYAASLRAALEWRERGHDRLDYAILTMDPNGAAEGLEPGAATVVSAALVAHGAASVGMTLSFLNAARFVAVVVAGPERAPIVQRLAHGLVTPGEAPLAGLDLLNGSLKWYLDGDACRTGTEAGN